MPRHEYKSGEQRVEKWLRQDSYIYYDNEGEPDHQLGIVGDLYQSCEKLFRYLWVRDRASAEVEESAKFSFKESFGNFVLWGKSFNLDELDEPCSDLEDVRIMLLELLVEIGKLLIIATLAGRDANNNMKS